MKLNNLDLSLTALVGEEYIDKVCHAAAAAGHGTYESIRAIADEQVSFWPEHFETFLDEKIPCAGQPVTQALAASSNGAGTAAFNSALHRNLAPLTGVGFFRIGEDGRLNIIGKSEHYQASLGHQFPGYQLVANAQRIGITNITHNNTRGHITRLLERELVRVANGLDRDDVKGLEAVIQSTDEHVLNRVINLETGSLACEAAFKMMLARFYKLQPHFEPPRYSGKTPVFLVMADYNHGPEANYHGTTIMTQMLRGMWSELYAAMEAHGLFKVVPVEFNNKYAFRAAVDMYDTGNTKVAGFMHELVLMNYGGIRLDNDYVTFCHAICQEHDIPVFIDEIQTGMWSPEIFLFKEYGCKPDFVSVGKGFPGGLYPASRIVTTAAMDTLNQFGALVTNGQEELASLAYLVTLRFAEANAAHTKWLGDTWQQKIRALAAAYPSLIASAEGDGLLSALFFHNADQAVAFCHSLGDRYRIDVSAQTYKANCPPAALMKLPLISSSALLDFVAEKMAETLREQSTEAK